MNNHPVILFDGICNLCNSVVNFTIKRDKKGLIRFTPLQSDTGQELLRQYGIPPSAMQSFIFIEDGKAYSRSTAALKVCRHLRGLWPLLYCCMIVPKIIRDGIYSWIARNRYKWFGTQEKCMVPTGEIKAKFLL